MQNDSYENLNEIVKTNKETRNFIIYCLVIIMFFFCWSLADRYFFINVQVVGASMENTLYGGDDNGKSGDVLYVDIRSDPKRGDIVVIDHKKAIGANSYEYIIKRLIGKPGDTITIKNGGVYRNGNLLDETAYIKRYNDGRYAKTSAIGGSADFITEKEWVLKQDEYFFLGDNRENSADSRYYGVAKRADIVGVVPSWSIKYKSIVTKKTKLFETIRKAFFGN